MLELADPGLLLRGARLERAREGGLGLTVKVKVMKVKVKAETEQTE